MPTGKLIVNVFSDTIARPIENATVEIIGKNLSFQTDSFGATIPITLDAPDPALSLDPDNIIQPFSAYDIKVTKKGMVPVIINHIEIFAGEVARQNVFMVLEDIEDKEVVEIDLDEHALWGDYEPKIVDENNTMGITPFVLPRILIPEFIIVHDGLPTNTNAPRHRVEFTDYIKNVACSEIFSTWPRESLRANVAAIVSFTLNRVFTEWYPSRGFNFTITSTTTHDQKYIHNRPIYDSIARVVDEHFREFIQFPGRREPFLANYNDGRQSNNPGWLSQWGTVTLANQGRSSIEILRHFYGQNLTIQIGEITELLPTSFPGYNLSLGSCGNAVLFLQNKLNVIRGGFPALTLIRNPNGEFDTQTQNAVRVFQQHFGPSVTGIVDFATWFRISFYYLAVARMVQSVRT